MPKFFLSGDDSGFETNNEITITGPDANHIRGALRHKKGDALEVSRRGLDFLCEITGVTEAGVTLKIISRAEDNREPLVRVTMFIAALKGASMDYAVQKCVELGAHEIVPVLSERCVVRPADKNNKAGRYQRIAESAAKQSLRGIVPRVTDHMKLTEALAYSAGLEINIFAHEKEKTNGIEKTANGKTTAGIFIGPEGGFTDAETREMEGRGLLPVSLGRRVMRAETAAAAALIIFLYESGEY